MNVLGKIFVIANLIFSVVTAALIMVVYTTRTNWNTRYLEMRNQVETATADAKATLDREQEVRKEAETRRTEFEAKIKDVASKLQTVDNENTLVKAELAKQKAAYEKIVQQAKEVGEVNNRLQKESALVKSQLGESNKRVVDLEREKAVFRNRAVESEIAAAGQREHNERLLEDNERLTRELQKAQAVATTGSRPGAVTAKSPPLEDLEGLVSASDAGFVTVTLGSNHGLKKDDTLEVFRLAPEAKYLGTIRILDVRADKAVGKPTTRLLAPIQVGDRVASRILGG